MEKIALFHPWIKSRGGSERTILELLKIKGYKIDVYTWVYQPEKTFEEFKDYNIKVIAPKIAEFFSRTYLLRSLFLPISLFSKIPLEKYGKFIVSTSGLAELITLRNYKPDKTLAYVYTPLRAADEKIILWNMENRYKNYFSRKIYLLAVFIYKKFEKFVWKNRINSAIFISKLSRERAASRGLIEDMKTKIIYPPISLNLSKKNSFDDKKDYFLYVSRFNLDKRQDILIEAWKRFNKKYPQQKLILVGNVENKKYFKKIKSACEGESSIEIKTNIKDTELSDIYQNSFAVIFVPLLEDFGIVPFEALAFGKPLIGVDKGGYTELIKDKQNFYKIKEKFLNENMVKEIEKSLESFLSERKKTKKIFFNQLSKEKFAKKMEKAIREF